MRDRLRDILQALYVKKAPEPPRVAADAD